MESKIVDLIPESLHEELLKEAEQILQERAKQKADVKPTEKELDEIFSKIKM